MDRQLKEKWLSALRSDRYPQGSGRLQCLDGTFCCLGVLGDLVNPDEWQPYEDGMAWRHHGGDLPDYLLNRDIQINLMRMNDDGMPFPEIADWIEENVLAEKTSDDA